MTKVHRELLARCEPVEAVNLDSVYGFQENVPQMSEKLEEYFEVSLHTSLTTLHLANYARSSELERTLFKQQVREANYVFAGPGSPSYALAQWEPLGLVDDLRHVLESGGTLCFASAAALTLGAFTAPIYEIYKVGAEPFWLAGLNLMGVLGLECVVIPHFDNQEGGNYDTRYCYLGERRLRILERELPETIATLGIDEHTAMVFDFTADTVQVLGRANGYWRHHDEVRVLANGTTTPLASLRTTLVRDAAPVTPPVTSPVDQDKALALGETVARGDAKSGEALAKLIRMARTGGEGFVDPSGLIEGVLKARRSARENGNYQLADELRDVLVASGVVVTDGPLSSTWTLGT
jgi:cyanophycinase-like exopeptidase